MFSYKSLAFGALIAVINSLLITCPTTDVRLTADPGVASSVLARSHTFVEIDHEIISCQLNQTGLMPT